MNDVASQQPAATDAPRPRGPLLKIENLSVELGPKDKPVRAVRDVSFRVFRGTTLGIIGESGCGKSTAINAITRLLPSSARVTSGEVRFKNVDLMQQDESAVREVRGGQISMIMQSPLVALDPLFTIADQMGEMLRAHTDLRGKALFDRQVELLASVGIPSPESRLKQYPHQMSGGMLQRIVCAIAISCHPDLLIADEPTTALDPTAQAQILELLADLRERFDLALIVVTHDFGVAARVCDEVMVMYAGELVEHGPIREIFDNPRHPYTQSLLRSVPREGIAPGGRLATIEGQPPDLKDLPVGCAFAARCPLADDHCRAINPPTETIAENHVAKCWKAQA